MKNDGNKEVQFKKGDRIAQLLLLPQTEEFLLDWEDTEKATLEKRGDRGFGSTGLYSESTVTPGEYLYSSPNIISGRYENNCLDKPITVQESLIAQMYEDEYYQHAVRENFY